ncbi:unnamed protein product [Phytomonas sp. EM1]|nr:unnamed protein product [Phytomonas sp. EM1]|eukprot:CCW62197.1 unnamed protein product [Phytomonas sp. isolate EM1]
MQTEGDVKKMPLHKQPLFRHEGLNLGHQRRVSGYKSDVSQGNTADPSVSVLLPSPVVSKTPRGNIVSGSGNRSNPSVSLPKRAGKDFRQDSRNSIQGSVSTMVRVKGRVKQSTKAPSTVVSTSTTATTANSMLDAGSLADRDGGAIDLPISFGPYKDTPHSRPMMVKSSMQHAALLEEHTIGEVFREAYNEKLRRGIESVLETLRDELPKDHIYLQLMSDPTTEQYCRVRLLEILEAFLYSTQAQHYHELVEELSKRELENYSMLRHLEEVEAKLEQCNAALETRSQSQRYIHYSKQTQVGTSQADLSVKDLNIYNPMSEETARRELMKILEATTRELELERTRQALVLPAKLAEVAHAEPRYVEKFDYVADVISELFRCLNGFLRHIDGSLESVEALRQDLSPGLGGGGGEGEGCGSSAHATRQQRSYIQSLSERVRDAQVLVGRVLERAAQDSQQHRREVQQLERSLEVARAEAAAVASGVDTTRQLQGSLEALRQEYQQTIARESEESLTRFHALRAQLDAALEENLQGRRERQQLQQVVEANQIEIQELQGDLERVQRGERLSTATVQTQQAEIRALQGRLHDCENEVLCTQVELHMATLEGTCYEYRVAKLETLQGEGYEPMVRTALHALHRLREELHHAEAQRRLAEAARFERAQRVCIEDLSLLLSSMREDADLSETVLNLMPDFLSAGAEKITPRSQLPVSGDASNGALVGDGHPSLNGRHQPPSTLDGLVKALKRAYDELRTQQAAWQKALRSFRFALAERDAQIQTLQSSEQQLRDLLQAEQERERQWRGNMDMLVETKSLKELLARQESLLQAVTEERNTLRKQWLELNEDYIAMERRNGILHERCSEKEYENARLTGLVESLRGTNRSRAFLPVAVSPTRAEVVCTPPAKSSTPAKGRLLGHEGSVAEYV